MKKLISSSLTSQVLPYLDHVFQYGLIALGFSLLFVDLNHISEYVFIGLLILWLGKKLFTEKWVFEKTPLDIPILVFLGWVLLTVPFATDWMYSLEEWRKALPRFLMFWLVVNLVKTEQHARAILTAFCLGILLLSLVEAFHFFAQGGESLSMKIRAGSLTGSSQWLSYYLVIGLPFLWIGITSEEKPWLRMTYIIALGMLLVALFLVHTRAAWLAVIVQGVVYVVWRVTRSWKVVTLVVLLSVGLLILFLALPGKHRKLISESEFTHPRSMLIRFNTWNIAVDDIREHPLTGIGYGKHSFSQKHPNLGKKFHSHIHNSFLSTAAQIGLPGFLLFVWVFWVILSKSSGWVTEFSDQYFGKLAFAVFLMTVGLIVRTQFDHMFMGTVVYLYMLLVGICFALGSKLQVKAKKGIIGGGS